MTASDGTPPWERAFAERRVRLADKLVLKLSGKFRHQIRDVLGRRLLAGDGIEIGAQYMPTTVDPARARVDYVDAVSNADLAARYDLGSKTLVLLSHIVEGDELKPYADGTKDFLIAHHVLEHIDDPVGAVVEWLRVLKDGGILFLSVPHFRGNWFDFRRVPPDRAHLDLDHRDAEGRSERNFQHYCDMAQSMWQFPAGDPRIAVQARAWTDAGDRHHYHVYDEETLRAVLELASDATSAPLELQAYLLLDPGFEILVAVKKLPTGVPRLAWPSRIVARISSLALVLRVAAMATGAMGLPARQPEGR